MANMTVGLQKMARNWKFKPPLLVPKRTMAVDAGIGPAKDNIYQALGISSVPLKRKKLVR